ncbi:MAG: substrate-binding domain-containing protein [Acidimicrobiia bacterium]|nr:substrate-binding domain-containing protein [Acidimicrobiia bacterium]
MGIVGLAAGTAHADYAPSGTDVVGVGGETPQYNVDFGADGDTSGDLGYNAANNVNKLVSIDATADSNGRAAYAQGSTEASPKNLSPTVVFRAGTNPVQRITSTGGGYTALLADTGQVQKINFTRAASLPTSANQTTAQNNGWQGLHVVQIGTDPLEVVAANTTNAPAGLSAAELVKIYNGSYQQWNQIPGNSGGSANAIIPLIPPSGSSISKTFLNDLKAANGGTAVTLASNVITVEQNDPGAVTGASSPADAIVPFSIGRLNLWNSGYFHSPTAPFPGGAALQPGVKALTGTPPDAGSVYDDVNGLYVVFRQSDANSPTPWQPGSTKNWVQTLFSDTTGGTPFFKKPAGQALVAAAGGVPGYNDLGIVSAG